MLFGVMSGLVVLLRRLRLAFGALFMGGYQPRLNYINMDVYRMLRYCALCARLLQKLQIICSATLLGEPDPSPTESALMETELLLHFMDVLATH
ncbi:hypothetical protein V6N13_001267 [Hibiscus sabdariffa]